MFRRFFVSAMISLMTCWAFSQQEIKVSEVTKDKLDKEVKLSGAVSRFQESRSATAPYSFSLKDETGEIRVAVWPDIFNQITARDQIRNTASVQVTGKITAFRDKLELHIAAPGNLSVKGAPGPAIGALAGTVRQDPALENPTAQPAGQNTAISTITNAMIDKPVTLRGKVSSMRPSSKDNVPYMMRLAEGPAGIDVVFWPTKEELASVKLPKVGDEVTVKGTVNQHRGNLQVRMAKASDMRVTPLGSPSTTAEPTTSTVQSGNVMAINSITKEQAGAKVTIGGSIASARAPKSETAPYTLRITDATGSIDVVFWKQTADVLRPDQKVEVGNQVKITGQVGEHRGTLQIKVEDPSGIEKVSESQPLSQQTPGPQSSVKQVKLSEVASAQPKSKVQIAGTVTAIEEIRLGKKITLEETGVKLSVLLWDSAEGLKPDVRFLRPQSRLTIQGVVEELNGSKVIAVTKPEDIIDVKL